MAKNNFLNIGCGKQFHPDWTNIDIAPTEPEVVPMNILERLKFSDNSFAVVYHSHVIEHIPRDMVHSFLDECFRVLEPNGVLRIAIPDMEVIAKNYLKFLTENIENPTDTSRANYEWTLIELFDQMVRNESGGEMKRFLQRKNLPNKEFIRTRSRDAEQIMDGVSKSGSGLSKWQKFKRMRLSVKLYLIGQTIRQVFFGRIMLGRKFYKIGSFRHGGEVHNWMYDRFSVCELLRDAGFSDIIIKSADQSSIANWQSFGLDMKDGQVYKPDSLFVEATKKYDL